MREGWNILIKGDTEMKRKVLLNSLIAGAILISGCSSKEEKKEENKTEQTQPKEKLSVENIKYENRKEPDIKYVSYGIIKLNADEWSKLTDEKLNTFIKQWVDKRDTYHQKSLIIYNESTKKAIIALGTEETVNYRPFEINVSQKSKFDVSNPTTTMYVWNEKNKTYNHVESQVKLDLTK